MPFRTDKVELGYLPAYQRLAEQIGPAGYVCEVGVAQGGSLELWQALFPQGLVVGVDRDPDAHWPQGAVQVIAEQADAKLPVLIRAYAAAFDLIVEDAAHDGDASRRTWELLWPLVRPGRWYVIEDWMVGFPTWTGPGPQQPSMLEAATSLLWNLAHPHSDVDEIVYRYGMIMLRKKPSDSPS